MANKQELEQQLNEAIAVAQRLNEENKKLTAENSQLKVDFDSAVERVRYLDGRVKVLESQLQAKTRFSDSDKNY